MRGGEQWDCGRKERALYVSFMPLSLKQGSLQIMFPILALPFLLQPHSFFPGSSPKLTSWAISTASSPSLCFLSWCPSTSCFLHCARAIFKNIDSTVVFSALCKLPDKVLAASPTLQFSVCPCTALTENFSVPVRSLLCSSSVSQLCFLPSQVLTPPAPDCLLAACPSHLSSGDLTQDASLDCSR